MKANPPHSKRRQPLIVFSHLRWDFVTQRPQHLLTRLANHFDILYIEEPISHNGFKTKYKQVWVDPHIKVIQIHAPTINDLSYQEIALEAISDQNFQQTPLLWLYSAAFIPFAKLVPHQILVYDCMDELASFKGATSKLKIQEQKLLNQADLVFTGGHSLYKSKSQHNSSTHCFPSSVDIDHFVTAKNRSLLTPKDIASIPHPIVGFYGVLDERLDLKLIKSIADRKPDVSFVFIGPVVKIDPAILPQASNIYYLGQKEYKELPSYLQEFDIAFMPFALNRATKYISPTKTLEFMAALKPIISTPITDVVNDYSDTVTIVSSPRELIQAINRYLQESKTDKQKRQNLQNQVLNKSSWDKTAAAMKNLITRTLARKRLRILDAQRGLGEYV